MSVTLVTFAVDDTSPYVSYSPLGDTFSVPNLIAGWNPYYTVSGYAKSQGEVGVGTSQHITSLNGASLGLQWQGTGITLLGNATGASYSITLDRQLLSDPHASPASNVLADLQGLTNAQHTLRLTAQIPESASPPTSAMVVFDQAMLFSSPVPVADNIGFQNQTINDQQIAFLGRWSITSGSSTPGAPEFHSTNNIGDRAIANFSGTTLLLLGQTSPTSGNYSVSLDNATFTTFSAHASFTQSDSLLFFATDLDPSTTHSVVVENLDGTELALLVGGFRAVVPNPIPPTSTDGTTTTPTATPSPIAATGTSFSEGTIAAFALAGILVFILISGCLYFFCVYRPKRQRRQQQRRTSFYPQKFVYDPAQGGGSPKAHEAGGAGLGGVVIGGHGGRGRNGGHADVLDIAPTLGDKDPEDARRRAGDDDDDDEVEGRQRGRKRWSLMSDFQRWRRTAVRGSLGGVSLGIRFRSSDSDNEKGISTTSPLPTTGTAGNTNNTQTNTNSAGNRALGFLDNGRPASSAASLPSSGSTARRERAKRKGKMRAVSGRSWSPSFLLDLPIWLGGGGARHSQRQSQRLSALQAQHLAGGVLPRGEEEDVGYHNATSTDADVDAALFAAEMHGHAYARAAATGAGGEHPPSYAASVSVSASNRDSNRDSHSDPSSFVVPSGPRSVSSNSPVFHAIEMQQQQHNNAAVTATAVGVQSGRNESRQFVLSEAAVPDVPLALASTATQAIVNIKDVGSSSNVPAVRPLPSVAQHKRQQQQQQQKHAYAAQSSPSTGPGLHRKIIDPRLIDTSLETTDDNPSIEEPHIMREVLRSLSPRTSRLLPIPPPPPRRPLPQQALIIAPTPTSQPAPTVEQSPDSDDAASPELVTSPTRRLLPLVESSHESRWMGSAAAPSGGGRTVKALPRTPTSDDDDQGELVGGQEGGFLNMPETSPFRVDFESKSTRTSVRPLPPTARPISETQSGSNSDKSTAGGRASSDESTSDPLYYATAAESSYKPARNTFGASESSHAGGSRLSEFIQGTSSSHQPFRLPSISFKDSQQRPETHDGGNSASSPDGPSPATSEGVVSFIDFTSSPEGSVRVPSEKSSSKKKAKRGRRRSLPVPPLVVEPQSRWSNTTVPSIATNPQGDGGEGGNAQDNDSSGESQKPMSPVSEHLPTDLTTFPISVQGDTPPSPLRLLETPPLIMSTGTPQSQRSSSITQSDNLHVHPILESLESPTDSLPLSTSEIRFRHSDSEDDSLHRRARYSSTGANEGASNDEYRPRPFDPNILVSRVLGMSSPTSSLTVRPPHSRSQSNLGLSSATTSTFPISSRHDSSNDQLNSRPGQS